MLVMDTVLMPLFFSVAFCAMLVPLPTFTLSNERLDGVSVVGEDPVPIRYTVWHKA